MKKSLIKIISISLAALTGVGGIASVLCNKDVAMAKAYDEAIDLGLKASDFITPSGYLIPTANKWVPNIGAETNPYDYDTMSFTIPKGTVFSADISGTDNELFYQLNKLAFSFDVSVAGCVKEVKVMKFDKTPYDVLNSVTFSDTTLTTYSGVLEFEIPDGCSKIKVRVENTNTQYVISNFSMSSYKIVTTANVSFNMQGHGSQVASQTVDIGSKVTQPSNPSATGYTFGGWYKEAACTNAWNFNTDTVSEDMTLYAKWTINSYTVQFNVQGHGTAPSNQTIQHGGKVTQPSAPTATGYTFGGWYKEASCTNAWNFNTDTVTSAKTIYAKWTPISYTLTYNLNGGTATNPASYNIETTSFTLNNPTKTGYTFDGWSGTGISGKSKSVTIAKGSTGNRSYTANWIANTYTVQYNGNKPAKAPSGFNVTGVPENDTWTYDSNATLGSAPSLTGYVFGGWYKDASCTNKVGDAGDNLTKPNLSPTQGATVNLYAKWSFDPAVQDVVDKINATKACEYTELTDKIEIADTAYNALSSELQSIIDSEEYTQILNNAKAADAAGQLIENLGTAQDTQAWRDLVSEARAAYDALEDKSFIPDEILRDLQDDEAAIVVMDKINAIGDPHWTTPSKTLIDDAQSAYDSYIAAHHPHSQIANFETLVAANNDYDRVDDFVNLVDDIVPSPYIYSSTLKEKIDDAREWYEETLSDSQKGLVQEKDETIYHAYEYYDRLVNYENAYEASRLIDLIDEIENTAECKAKIEEAREALDALNETSELPLVDVALIKELEDDEAAFAVIELINAIYPMSYGEDCENAIQAARDAYEALDDSDQKPKVTNLDMLIKAEEDYAKIVEVVETIDAIGDIRYNEASLDRIEEARNTYEALTNDQKDAFPEDVLQQIVDYEKAYEALDMFYNIGEVSYDTDSEEKIKEAQAYYDSLSKEQKDLIHVDDLKVLLKSVDQYETLQKKANILVILLLIFVCLTIIGGFFFLFFLLKRRKDEDEEEQNNGTVKVASVGGLLPLITFASHYIDAPYLALYILSGVAVILWLSILGLVLYRKFKKPEVVGVSSEASLALPCGAQEEANAILQSIKKDEEESKLVVDKKGNLFQIRYIKSFTAKLSQSSDLVKERYNELKNKILSYKGVTSRVSWHYDSINAGKEALIKFAIRGKTLCVYFSPKIENPGEGFKLEESKGRRYEKVPYLFRIKSDKKFEQVKELIAILMKRFKLVQGKLLEDDYKIPFETTEILLQKGLTKELARHLEVKEDVKNELLKSVAVEKVDELMSDDTAEALIEEDTVNRRIQGKKEIINVDTLSANFKDGDVVNLETLIEKKLVSSKTVYVKVLARGVLDKKLNVDLHDYSIQAVKMILLTGGSVKKIQ